MTTPTAPRILEIDYGRLLAARPVRYAVAGMTIALFGSLELLVPDSGPRLANPGLHRAGARGRARPLATCQQSGASPGAWPSPLARRRAGPR